MSIRLRALILVVSSAPSAWGYIIPSACCIRPVRQCTLKQVCAPAPRAVCCPVAQPTVCAAPRPVCCVPPRTRCCRVRIRYNPRPVRCCPKPMYCSPAPSLCPAPEVVLPAPVPGCCVVKPTPICVPPRRCIRTDWVSTACPPVDPKAYMVTYKEPVSAPIGDALTAQRHVIGAPAPSTPKPSGTRPARQDEQLKSSSATLSQVTAQLV